MLIIAALNDTISGLVTGQLNRFLLTERRVRTQLTAMFDTEQYPKTIPAHIIRT